MSHSVSSAYMAGARSSDWKQQLKRSCQKTKHSPRVPSWPHSHRKRNHGRTHAILRNFPPYGGEGEPLPPPSSPALAAHISGRVYVYCIALFLALHTRPKAGFFTLAEKGGERGRGGGGVERVGGGERGGDESEQEPVPE